MTGLYLALKTLLRVMSYYFQYFSRLADELKHMIRHQSISLFKCIAYESDKYVALIPFFSYRLAVSDIYHSIGIVSDI